MPGDGQFLRIVLLAALLVSAWLPAAPGYAGCTFSQAYETCAANANGVTSAMRRCANHELERQMERLHRALSTIMASPRISAGRKNKLDAAQKAWEANRNQGCIAAAQHDAGGGTLALLLATDCAVCQTAERAAQLEAMLQE